VGASAESQTTLKQDRIVYFAGGFESDGEALTTLLNTQGIMVRPLPRISAADNEHEPGCVFIDGDASTIDQPAIFAILQPFRATLPVIMTSKTAEIAAVVAAMRLGAGDFLVRPLDRNAVVGSLAPVFDRLEPMTRCYWRRRALKTRIATLSDREADILRGLLAGNQNKMLAHLMGISVRTVEMHRANLMAKLGVHSLAEAIRLTFDAGLAPGELGHALAETRTTRQTG
jgi:two-component system response regulator FixJ